MEPEIADKIIINIPKKWIPFLVVLVIIGIIAAGIYEANSYINGMRKAEQTSGYTNGYNQCLIDIPYTISQQGEAKYVVPTTNITVTLAFKSLPTDQ